MTPTFTGIPPDDRGYPGMVKLPLGGGRELVALGYGPEVEAEMLELAKERAR